MALNRRRTNVKAAAEATDPSTTEAFLDAVQKLVHDLKAADLPVGLRMKQVSGHPGVYEVTWAPDGRATFSLGYEVRPGHPHVIWRRVGTHDIFDEP